MIMKKYNLKLQILVLFQPLSGKFLQEQLEMSSTRRLRQNYQLKNSRFRSKSSLFLIYFFSRIPNKLNFFPHSTRRVEKSIMQQTLDKLDVELAKQLGASDGVLGTGLCWRAEGIKGVCETRGDKAGLPEIKSSLPLALNKSVIER